MLGSAQLSSAQLSLARLGSARLGSARLGSTRLGSTTDPCNLRYSPLRAYVKKSPDFGQGQHFFVEVARFRPSFLTFLKIMLFSSSALSWFKTAGNLNCFFGQRDFYLITTCELATWPLSSSPSSSSPSSPSSPSKLFKKFIILQLGSQQNG